MSKNLQIIPEQERFHLICRDFMGRYEGHLIGERLQLLEIQAPPDVPNGNGLLPGEYYLRGMMDHHPVLHALVTADRLQGVAELVRDFHLHVVGGAELLPDVPHVAPLAHHESAMQALEDHHRSVFSRGPRAVITAVTLWLVAIVVALGTVTIAARHLGDQHRMQGLSTIFARAEKPPPAQNWFQYLIQPDHRLDVRWEIRGVKFLEGNRMILQSGDLVEVEGVDDLRPLFEEARRQAMAPHVDAQIENGKVMIQRIWVADGTFVEGGELVRTARFGTSSNQPPRSVHRGDNVFWRQRKLPHDAIEQLKVLQGERIAIVGQIVEENGERILRHEDGAGIVLQPVRDPALDQLLAVFAGDTTKLEVDLILASVFPWSNQRDPAHSRKTTKLIGEGTVRSASAQNFHLIAHR